MNAVILCGSTCGHRHDSANGPSGCCADHGPYLYYCATCAALLDRHAPEEGR